MKDIKDSIRNSGTIGVIIILIIAIWLLHCIYNDIMLWYWTKNGNNEMFERMSYNNSMNLKEIVLMVLSYIFGTRMQKSKEE